MSAPGPVSRGVARKASVLRWAFASLVLVPVPVLVPMLIPVLVLPTLPSPYILERRLGGGRMFLRVVFVYRIGFRLTGTCSLFTGTGCWISLLGSRFALVVLCTWFCYEMPCSRVGCEVCRGKMGPTILRCYPVRWVKRLFTRLKRQNVFSTLHFLVQLVGSTLYMLQVQALVGWDLG